MVYKLSYNTWSGKEKSALQKVIKSGCLQWEKMLLISKKIFKLFRKKILCYD